MKTTLLIILAALLTGCIPFIDHNGPRRKWYYLSDAPPIPRDVSQAKADPSAAAVVLPPQKVIDFVLHYPPGHDADGWWLQTSSDVTSWVDVEPVFPGSQTYFTNTEPQPQQFFRLKKL